MISIFFGILLLVHGVIHLMGFAKAYAVAEIHHLSKAIPKPLGALWFLSAMAFAVATAVFFAGMDWWWMIGLPACLLSQVLIFTSWRDARFGTVANVVILVGAVLSISQWNFHSRVNAEVNAFLPATGRPPDVVSDTMLRDVPPVVGRWLRHAQVIGKERALTIHLRQSGEMRTAPDGSWMPFTAEQWFRTEEPGFIWRADVAASPWMRLSGRDKFVDASGNMLINVFAFFPVVDSRGEAIDQGAMVRYLAEVGWFPSAALSKYIRWEEVDSLTARGTMEYRGKTATGTFRFTPDGDLVSFQAQRFFERKEGATLEDWYVAMDPAGVKEFEGILIPTRSTVTWRLKDGNYTWLRLDLSQVHYNERID